MQLNELDRFLNELQQAFSLVKLHSGDDSSKNYSMCDEKKEEPLDFDYISKNVNENAFRYDSLVRRESDFEFRKQYIKLLAFFVLEFAPSNEGFTHIYSRAMALNLNLVPEEIYVESNEITIEEIKTFLSSLGILKHAFFTDVLICVLQSDNNFFSKLYYISLLAYGLSLEEKDLYVIGIVARCFIEGSYEKLDDVRITGENLYAGMFDDFIPQSWIESRRQLLCIGIDSEKMNFQVPSREYLDYSYSLQNVNLPKNMVLSCLNDGIVLNKNSCITVFKSGRTINISKNGVLKVVGELSFEHIAVSDKYIPVLEEIKNKVKIVYNVSIFDSCKWLAPSNVTRNNVLCLAVDNEIDEDDVLYDEDNPIHGNKNSFVYWKDNNVQQSGPIKWKVKLVEANICSFSAFDGWEEE